MSLHNRYSHGLRRRGAIISTTALAAWLACALPAAAQQDQVYFSAVDNVTNVLVQYINQETVRLDISSWYLSEHSISIAVANRFAAGVPVRLIGDRGAPFENDPHTKTELYWLASQGIPIRLRFNPTWFPEIDHWKAAIFVGQNVVEFGSGNFAPTELAPYSSTNYDDESELFTSDPTLVNAFKTKFDVMWNDTTTEPNSVISGPPYLKNWNDACASEPTGNCADYATLYPNPAPMIINTARLEPDFCAPADPVAPCNQMPADLYWGQGTAFNARLAQEITSEQAHVDLVVYRLEVDNITQALLNKFQAGVPVRIIVDPGQYTNLLWPEYWLTHANIDKLYAAGVPVRQTVHAGVTHMKTLITSTYATNASSNFGPNWQRDHNYFVSAATKPGIYQAFVNRFQAMWTDNVGFAPFTPTPPHAANLASPASAASGVATSSSLVWNIAPLAVSYDVYLGTSQSSMQLVGNVPAVMTTTPPSTYSWTPSAVLQASTTYYWKVVSRTNATPVNPAMIATSDTWSFTTAGASGPPPPASNPVPASGAAGVGTSPTLSWAAGPLGTTYTVAFGTVNPPPQVVAGINSASYSPGAQSANTTYYWSVTTSTSGGTTAGPVWSFTTGNGPPQDVVLYAGDAPANAIHGGWAFASDTTAANGTKLITPATDQSNFSAPLASPTDYVDVTFTASAGTPYTFWMRLEALNNSKGSDSVYVQFSDALVNSTAIYPINTTSALVVKLATDSTAASDFNWGWVNSAYWLTQPATLTFATNGTHTVRIQVRGAGVMFDQIVLSPGTYLNAAPGVRTNDTTIVPKPTTSPQPPGVPGSPSPAAGTSNVGTTATLTWSAAGATSYDVSFGTSNPPPQVTSGQANASYTPTSLVSSTTYFWQIVAHNSAGTAPGPVWSFATAVPAPAAPTSPSPASGASNVGTTPTLTWSAAGATSYDVKFGTTNPPPQATTGQASASYAPAPLANTATYFWQIVAHNSTGATAGAVWSFTTAAGAPPPPPAIPGSPNPTSGATAASTTPTLTWSAAGATSYDVAFGTTNPPPQVTMGQASASYTPVPLATSTTYFWQIVAHNSAGATTGAVWSFTTAAGAPSAQLPNFDHVFVVIMENQEYGQIIGNPSAPYINSLAAQYGLSTNYTAVAHPSLPNYMALTGGNTFFTDDCVTCTTSAVNIADSIEASGRTWTAYMEDMPGTCGTADAGLYAVKHNPFVHYSDISSNAARCTNIVPFSNFGNDLATGHLANYVWITPNLCSDMHDCSIATGDAWLSTNLPRIIQSPAFANSALFLVWDEGTTNIGGGGQVPLVVVSPMTPPGTKDSSQGNHYSLLRTIEDAWKLAPLGQSASATALTAFFRPPAVIYAGDVAENAIHGGWAFRSDPTAASGTKLISSATDQSNFSAPLASPTDYVDVTFTASAGTPYTFWMRLEALNNSKASDSVYVQFSDALVNSASIYALNTTSALVVKLATDSTASSDVNWGWVNSAYWLTQPATLTFATSGTHTMRIQVRGAGVMFDQIVLSPSTYLNSAPGVRTNDTTIVPKPH